MGLLLVAAVAATLVPATGSAQIADDAPTVDVLVDSVTPAVPKAKSSLRISGRVANTSAVTISGAQIRLNLSPTPLLTRGEVPQVLSGESNRVGEPVAGFSVVAVDTLEPGQQSSFTLRVKLADLGLPPTPGVYAFFVNVAAQEAMIGRAGVTLPWFPKKAKYSASKVAFLWPITQDPAVAGNELVLDAELPREFGADGRLGQLLNVGARSSVSWLVDAATFATAKDLADGYQIQTREGPEPGDRAESAEEFITELQATLADQQSSLPGYAVADADALNRADLTAFVVRSATLPTLLADRDLKSSDPEVLFAPPGGATDSTTMQVLVDAGVRAALFSEAAFPTEEILTYTPTGATTIDVGDDRISVYLTDTQLATELSQGLATTPERSRAQQAILADLAMITLERPTVVRRVIAEPPPTWNPPERWSADLLAQIERAPWIDPIQLSEVLQGPLLPRQTADYGREERRQELPRGYMQRIREQEAALESLSRIVNDPTGFGETFTLALQRAASGLWRGQRAARDELMDTITAQLAEERAKVAVVSAGSVTLAGDNGRLPLTVANDLDRDVTVGIDLRTDNQARLKYTAPDPVTVKAGQKTGLEVPIQVAGSQPLEVTVMLTDAKGVFFSDSATLQLQSTASTRIAAIVVGLGAAALVVLVALRLWRRRRG
ncbi:MAG: hypothetical protein K0U64_11065 [Actinomycetia bacterium]|nr:hypothetical protein [Actinomycetes bacterium]